MQCLNEEFRIKVKTLTGKEVSVSVTNDTTILAVKQALAGQFEAAEKQRLIFGGKHLTDEKTVAEYEIKRDAVLHLIFRLRGWHSSKCPLTTEEELTKEVRLRVLIKQVADLNTRLDNKEAPPFFSFSEKSAALRTSSTLTMCPANIYITLNGTEGSPYEGTTFDLHLQFPSDYPFKPFRVVFTTFIWHPLVDSQGRICLDVLCCQWSPPNNIIKILEMLRTMLIDPESVHDGSGCPRYSKYLEDKEGWRQKAKAYCDLYQQKIWKPEWHHLTPPSFRAEVKQLLLVNNRLNLLPRELVLVIISFMPDFSTSFASVASCVDWQES